MTTSSETYDRELTEILHSRGQRVTPQRVVMNRVLRSAKRHVTAEDVLREVTGKLPNVSLPTVYATLELFEELGLVRRVATESGPALFDSRTDEHQHVVCRRCGRVQDLDTLMDASSMSGTLPYIAPEILRGEPSDYRSDLWALGVVLYETASGHLPFDGRTGFEITAAIMRELPKPLGLPVPPGLWAIIQRCLAKEPAQRYQRAGLSLHGASRGYGYGRHRFVFSHCFERRDDPRRRH